MDKKKTKKQFVPSKSLESRYSKKTINPSYYETVNVEGLDVSPCLTHEELAAGKAEYILVPYVFAEHTKESLAAYNKIMKKYRKEHEFCPKCGAKGHSTTLMGYPLKDVDYKDLNICVCSNCGDKHTAHERISLKELRNLVKEIIVEEKEFRKSNNGSAKV